MFYSDLFHKKNNSNDCFHRLIIDLSNDVFFHIFYRHLTKISEIETVDIGPKHRSRGLSKTNKN